MVIATTFFCAELILFITFMVSSGASDEEQLGASIPKPNVPCTDQDGDGYLSSLCRDFLADDCNDLDAAVSPDADEVCGDNVDNDCDGQVDEGCAYALLFSNPAIAELLDEHE